MHLLLSQSLPNNTMNTQYMLVEWIKQHTVCIEEFIIISSS